MQSEVEIISRVHQVGSACARIEKPIWQEQGADPEARHAAVALIADVARLVKAKISGQGNGELGSQAGSAQMRGHHREAVEGLQRLEISEPRSAAIAARYLGELENELLGAISRLESRRLVSSPS